MNTQRDESFLRTIFAEHDPAATGSPGSTSTGSSTGTPVNNDKPRQSLRHRSRWRGPLVVATAAAALIVVVATNGLGLVQIPPAEPTTPATPTTSEETPPDVSADGRVAYGCTLALDAHQHGDVNTWHISPNQDSSPAWRELVAVPGLLGALVGAAPEGHPELRHPVTTLAVGINNLDTAKMQDGLDEVVTWCREHPQLRSPTGADVDGRAAYACALAIDAASYGHVDIDTWNITVGDDAGTPWRELVAIPGLLGVLDGSVPEGHEALGTAAMRIEAAISGGSSLDVGTMQTALDDFIAQCRR